MNPRPLVGDPFFAGVNTRRPSSSIRSIFRTSPQRANPTGRETPPFFQAGNGLVEWNLDLSATHLWGWTCMLRFAHNRRIPRFVQKLSLERISWAMKVSRRVASMVLRCLAAIGVISIDGRGGFTWDGERRTHVYVVPPVHAFTEEEVQRNIARARRTHPDLFLLRPDQAKIREKLQKAKLRAKIHKAMSPAREQAA